MTLQGLHLQPLSHGGQASRQAFQRDVNVHWRDNNIIFIPRFSTVKWRCQHYTDWNPCSVQAWCSEAVVTLEFMRLRIVLTVGDKEGPSAESKSTLLPRERCLRKNFTVAKLIQTIFITALRCVIHLEKVIFVASSLKGVPSANQSESIFISRRKKNKLYDFSKFYASGIASERFSL